MTLATRGDYFGEMAPASHSRKKSEMWSALAELGADAEFFPTIVSRLSDGEFLSTIAGELKVNHSILRNWIRGDKAREAAYLQAEQDGRQARIATVLRKTYDIAVTDSTEPPTRMEQLRAAEIMLKQGSGDEKPTNTFGDITINFVSAKDGRPEGIVIDQLPGKA